MKKGLVLACSATALMLALSTVAEARDGFYLTARGGKTWFNLNRKDDAISKSADLSFDPVGMYSGAVGYKYRYFRGEIEYIWREGSEEDAIVNGIVTSTSEVEAESLMLNMYFDLMPNYWISPFVGGGIGYSQITYTNSSPRLGQKTTEDDKFSWQIGGGLTIRINKCLNIDGGYRYYTLGKIEEGEVNGHEWYAGIRFTF